MSYRRRFEEFGVAWPSLERPALPFSPTVRVADIVYVSGQIPEIAQEIAAIGQVGREIDLAAAQNAARLCRPTSSIGWTRNWTAILTVS